MPPDVDEPLLPPAPPEAEDTGWLITFSDLVLQLFGFVLLWAVLSVGTKAAAGPAAPAVVEPPAPEAPRTWRTAEATAARDDAVASAEHVAAAAAIAEPESARTDPAPDAVEPEPLAAAAPSPAVAEAAPDAPELAPSIAAAAGALAVIAGGSEAVSVTQGPSDVVLTLGEAVSFAPGAAELAPAAEPILAGVRRIAEAMPDLRIEVVGHTDDRPIRSPRYPSNLELSLARAARVAHELAAGDAALGARIVASGQGPHHPIASNDDAEGRARNRRVEIRLRPTG